MKCDFCGRNNHEINNCFFYKRHNQKKNDEERSIQTAIKETSKHIAFMCSTDDENQSKCDANEIKFLLDSGATDHLVNSLDFFTFIEDLKPPSKITIAKRGEYIMATKRGNMELVSNHGMNVKLEGVLYTPELPQNVISVKRLQKKGLTITFEKDETVTIKLGSKPIVSGISEHNLTSIVFKRSANRCMHTNVAQATNSDELWHERLGHIHGLKFSQLKNLRLHNDINILKSVNPINKVCEACVFAKQARLPFAKCRNREHVNRPLFAVHTDVCGPIKPSTIDEKNYFVTFIDEYTHYVTVYLMSKKSDVFTYFKDFAAKSENHFNSKIAYLYCDNGTEYLSNEMKAYCVEKGIQYHLTVPHTPQQNSIAERMNRTLLEKARSMIFGAKLNKELWGEAVLTAAYLINMSPTKALLETETPYELWHNRKPNIGHLRIFGCTAYVLNKNPRSKLDEKSYKGILVGYNYNGYKILDIERNKVIVARDVTFDEMNYMNTRPSIEIETHTEQSSENLINEQNLNIDRTINNDDNQNVTNSQQINEKNEIENVLLRRSERIKKNPTISYKNMANGNNCYFALDKPSYYSIEEQCYYTFAQSVDNNIPESYDEIQCRNDRNQWEQAIKDELNSLHENNTWNIVPLPNNKNIVDCKWVFSIKNDSDGNLTKYKARLVAKGFSQKYLLDYDETFAPVARITTFRMMMAFAIQNDLLVHQMDVKTAFLNGELSEEIYMKIPEGVTGNENHVCKLNKALYGLKQSARCWFEKFEQVLKQHGFESSDADKCLFILNNGDITKNIYVILYVDDVIIITFEIERMNRFKEYLSDQFNMKDMNEAQFFLGIKISRQNGKMIMSQSAYLKSVLKRFAMNECNSISTPLADKLNYKELNSDEHCDAPCRNLIGCLMYAMLCTRPDLCVALNLLSRFQNKNNKELWQSLKRILRYIRGTLHVCLTYKRNGEAKPLTGFVDSDWAGDEIDRKSTTGYLFKLYNNTISWNSKRQQSVATSSTEAEYMALYEGVKEACWLRSILSNIKLNLNEPTIIYEDNNGCIAIANNPTDHKRTKHIDIKYHFIRDKIQEKLIALEYISTGEQQADMFTKALAAVKFGLNRDKIGLQAIEMHDQNACQQ